MARKNTQNSGNHELRCFKSGSIKKIYLKDFMTYHEVEVYPGPNLNVVIGPNGTGKSTLMCAICLGLGGDPSAIGRASKMVEYIRSEQSKAVIEITLHNETGGDVVVRHTIRRDGKNEWAINGKTERKETVFQIFRAWNINLNNLCQFQSQEKVQDFAKMSNQELLKNTQVCTGDQSLGRDLEQLKSKQSNLAGLNRELTINKSSLEKLLPEIARLEKDVEDYKTSKHIEDQIDLRKKKIELLKYQDLKGTADQAKREVIDKRNIIAQTNQAMKPLNDKIAKAKQRLDTVLREVTFQDARLVEKSNSLARRREQISELVEKIHEERSEFETNVEDNKKMEREIAELEAIIQRDKNGLETVRQNDVDLDDKINEVKVKIALNEAALHDCQVRRNACVTKMNNHAAVLSDFGRERNDIMDIPAKRLNKLREANQQAYEAYKVLQEMRGRGDFRAPVYEPLAITLSVKEKEHAKFVEKTISGNDLYAFGFEDKGDMNRFLTEARKHRKLRVAAYHCPPGPDVREDPTFQNPVSMSELSQWGFQHYMSDLVVLNNTQLRFLCKMYRLHAIPLGTDEVMRHLAPLRERFGQQISLLFGGDVGYSVRKSAFSGEYLTTSWEVGQARILTTGMDQQKLDLINAKIVQCEKAIQEERTGLQEVEKKFKELNKEQENLKNLHRDLLKQKNCVASLQAQIARNTKKIQERRGGLNDLEELKKRMTEKCKRLLLEISTKQEVIIREVEEMKSSFRDQGIRIVLKERSKRKWTELDKRKKDEEASLEEVKAELSRAERAYSAAKGAAADKLKLLKLEKVFESDGSLSPDLISKFRMLSDDIEGIEQEIANDEARLSCMSSSRGSANLVKEYEEKHRQMESLRRNEEKTSQMMESLESEIRVIRERYITKLEGLVTEISTNFGHLLATMGCAGEVILDKGTHEHDYDKYGIRIRVKFRDSEQLRDLTHYSQSGGEKSVATALYMMAIQKLTTVPFRCVDEINQGMDAANERKVFDLLVQTSCCEDSAQYFLLTPKLLPKLNYSRGMTIHDVHNGKSSLTFKQWKEWRSLR